MQIESTDEGAITLELPREFIGAEKQDGKDDTFIILIDGIEVDYEETSKVGADSRIISINFEQGDSDIEIIGTYVIPEFGTIVMIVLTVGIMSNSFSYQKQISNKNLISRIKRIFFFERENDLSSLTIVFNEVTVCSISFSLLNMPVVNLKSL